ALFNQTEDANRGDDSPTLPLPSPAQRAEREKIDADVKRLAKAVKSLEKETAAARGEVEKTWHVPRVVEADSNGGAKLAAQKNGWPVAAAIDGKTETGWAVSPRKNERHVAIFDFAEPLKLDAESTLRVVISQQYGKGLTLLRFRITTSDADPAGLTPASDPPEL